MVRHQRTSHSVDLESDHLFTIVPRLRFVATATAHSTASSPSPSHTRITQATERQFLRERKSMARLTQALLPQIDHTVIAALPMSAGDAGAAPIIIGEDGAETTTSDGDGGQVALSERSVAAYKESMKLLDDVSVGAIANTGALPRDSAQWYDAPACADGLHTH